MPVHFPPSHLLCSSRSLFCSTWVQCDCEWIEDHQAAQLCCNETMPLLSQLNPLGYSSTLWLSLVNQYLNFFNTFPVPCSVTPHTLPLLRTVPHYSPKAYVNKSLIIPTPSPPRLTTLCPFLPATPPSPTNPFPPSSPHPNFPSHLPLLLSSFLPSFPAPSLTN